jgi:hypothetical protein
VGKRARFDRPTEWGGDSIAYEKEAERHFTPEQKRQIARNEARDAEKSGLVVRRCKLSELKTKTGVQTVLNGGAFSEIGMWWPRRGRHMLSREEAIDSDKYPWWSSEGKETSVPFGSMKGEFERVSTNIGRVPFDCLDPDGLPSKRNTKEGRN